MLDLEKLILDFEGLDGDHGGYSTKDIEKAVNAAVSSALAKFQPQPNEANEQ